MINRPHSARVEVIHSIRLHLMSSLNPALALSTIRYGFNHQGRWRYLNLGPYFIKIVSTPLDEEPEPFASQRSRFEHLQIAILATKKPAIKAFTPDCRLSNFPNWASWVRTCFTGKCLYTNDNRLLLPFKIACGALFGAFYLQNT